MSAHPSIGIANAILRIAEKRDLKLTMMQVLKLVYIAHGWSLALLNEPLTAEAPQAWQHGPVYPKLYKALRPYGSQPVTDVIRDPVYGLEVKADLEPRQEEVLEAVVDSYGKFHAFQLSNMTHRVGTPWSVTYDGGNGQYDAIPETLIRDHYIHLRDTRLNA